MNVEKEFPKLVESPSRWGLEHPSYDEVLAKLGTVIESETLGSYQGDIIAVLEKDGQFGFVSVGYGSCSGCDAMEACSTVKDVQELVDSIEQSVQWKGGPGAMCRFMREHDWAGAYYGENSETNAFKDRVIAKLEGVPKKES